MHPAPLCCLQTADYSTQIFSLGVLLSSLLVFNQVSDMLADSPTMHVFIRLHTP